MSASKQVARTIAERVRERRDALGLSQDEVAQRLGPKASRVQVSHYECQRRTPTAAVVRALAVALRCSADWLLGLTTRVDNPEVSATKPVR